MRRVSLAAVAILGIVLTIGAIAPGIAPVIVATPSTGSMQPTAPPGSLVVATDTAPEVDDIALFDSARRETPVLHRLVAVSDTPPGFLTQGDANPVTDQASGAPPVQRADIYGTVPTIAGHPVVLPHLGVILTNPFIAGGVWGFLALSLLYSTTSGEIVRETVSTPPLRVHIILTGLLITFAIPTAIVATPVTVQTEILTTSTAPADASHLVLPGEIGQQTVTVSSPVMAGLQTTVHATGDLAIESVERSPRANAQVVTVVNQPAPAGTVHSGTITVYSYPAIWPASVLNNLAAIHPFVAGLACSSVFGGAVILLAFLFVDPYRPVRASKSVIYRYRRSKSHVQEPTD